jgi:hypothetical protein
MRTRMALGLLLAASCRLPSPMTAADLAGRAQRDLLGSQRDLVRRRVAVRGVVQQTSLVPRNTIIASGFGAGVSIASQQESLPLVIMEPGTVLCYFEPEDIDDATGINLGNEITLDCQVQAFRVDGAQHLSILHDCRRP